MGERCDDEENREHCWQELLLLSTWEGVEELLGAAGAESLNPTSAAHQLSRAADSTRAPSFCPAVTLSFSVFPQHVPSCWVATALCGLPASALLLTRDLSATPTHRPVEEESQAPWQSRSPRAGSRSPSRSQLSVFGWSVPGGSCLGPVLGSSPEPVFLEPVLPGCCSFLSPQCSPSPLVMASSLFISIAAPASVLLVSTYLLTG